ncbi:hypothetical protein CBS101457_005553 [Exobasidium rhododendri]|nr:hypothetical protein CBS101457_005553 [Exobasidium rhododendri]
MTSTTFSVLVTGSNRGIGYGIVRRAVREYRNSYAYKTSSLPLQIYLTSRDESQGKQAIESIKAELKPEDLKNASIEYHQLDISDVKSKENIINFFQAKERGGLDVLINNAGIALNGFDASVVEKTFAMNYHNVTDFNERVLPILKPNGRIVILASMAGALNGYSSEIVQRFRSVSSKKEADSLALEYQREAKEDIGSLRQKGWKEAAYSVSKCCVIAYTRGKSNDLRAAGVTDKAINCCCPGYVNTDMTKGKGVKTIDQGAATPVMLALADLKGRSGGYYQDERESDW